MTESDRMEDDQLETVSGGGGRTKWGFNYDDKGTVYFKGLKINAADWAWLHKQYRGNTEDPEYYISTVSAIDIAIILNEHHQGKI
ncbi:MAG: hypothetical protein J5829_00585 [Lachnospiraceae bacterium]|nr:hypothetical protein [Lachnospiraceae bacterium]